MTHHRSENDRNTSHQPDERLLDLLVDQALHGLAPSEEDELRQLLQEGPHADLVSMERAASALTIALQTPQDQNLPPALRAQLERDALDMLPMPGKPDTPEAQKNTLAFEKSSPPSNHRKLGSFWSWAGWVVAVASVVLALVTWWPRSRPQPRELLRRLLAETSEQELVRLSKTESDPETDTIRRGDFFWSNARQEGYMRLRGLPPNDPQRSQYQLWIFDAKRDQRYPVDGGVFDVASDGEVVVPIRAKLQVHKPTIFAITRERPGGVVVSDRKQVVLLAERKMEPVP